MKLLINEVSWGTKTKLNSLNIINALILKVVVFNNNSLNISFTVFQLRHEKIVPSFKYFDRN